MDTVAQLAQRVDRDPAAAAREAAEAAADASARHDWIAASRAHAVRGRALRMLGEMALAERALRDAVAAAARDATADGDVEADARLALAGVLSAAGHHADAFAELDTAEPLASAALVRRIDVQRAALLRDAGRHDEALERYASVIPELREAGPRATLARALANRAGIRVHLGDLAGAAADYEEAAALFRADGSEFVALNVISDLGCVAANLGDLPRALLAFDEAAEGMAALGHDASMPVLARADALLLAGLTADAMTSTADAARRLQAAGRGLSAAKALLVVAQAARHEGDVRAALDAATAAAATFATGGADGWARAAELEVLWARHRSGVADADDVARADGLAAAFGRAGDPRGELRARCLAGVIAVSLGDAAAAAAQIERARALAPDQTADGSLTLHIAAAVVHLALGDLPAARLAVGEALDAAADHAVTGVTTVSRRELGPVVARLAIAEPDHARALAWVEAEHATRRGGAREATDAPDDRDRFARLRIVSGDLRRAEREGAPTDQLRREQAHLEQVLRDERLRRRGSRRDVERFDLDGLRTLLGDAAAVSLVITDDAAAALVVDADAVRRVELPGAAGLRRAGELAGRALRGLAGTGGAAAVVEARRRAFEAAIVALDEVVDPALDLDARHLVLSVPPELRALPWAALGAMRGRSFTITPSLAWWAGAARRMAPAAPSVAVIAGPRLAHADAEAQSVAACHPGATVLAGAEATADAALDALATHDIVHLVAHGRFRRDSPEWSTIELADGPLPVRELASLPRVPSTVVIATCESATAGGRPGAQVEGIADALLDRGARTVVASIGSLPDDGVTIAAMAALHTAIRAGTGAADALAALRSDPLEPTSASLVTLGVGDR